MISSFFCALFFYSALTAASINLGWEIHNTSSTLRQITFPISMPHAPHEDGFYFAQQFSFEGVSDVGYAGLQPRKDEKNASIVHAVFSSFIDGTTSVDRNCHGGTDGSSAGVSCKLDIHGNYDHPYNITVENIKGKTWVGNLIDTVSNKSTRIGTFTLPTQAGAMKTSQVGFVEYFPWNSVGDHPCDSLPYTHVTFGQPWSAEFGVEGTIKKPTQEGSCKGKTGFKTRGTRQGYEVSVGKP